MKATTKYRLKSKCPHGLWKAMVSCYRFFERTGYKCAMIFGSKNMEYSCPCCGYKFKRFVEGEYRELPDFYDVSLFENMRQDVQCPVCGSLPRHRILASWCEDNKGLLEGKKILYFAPERSMTRWLKKRGIAYTTADLFNVDTVLRLDIQKTGLPDGSYDVIICNHVLEHVDDYMTALREVRRVLTPDGILICSFPVSPDVEFVDEDKSVTTDAERLKRYSQADHVRLFGMKADKFMTDAGFDVSFIDGKDYPSDIVPVTGPCRYDIDRLYLCRVRGV